MEQFRKTVAKNIAELRIANGYTQFELGEKINYSDKAVSKWERGESVPDAYVLKKLAGIFEVSVDYLLEEHPDDAKKPKARNKYKTITQISFLGTYTLAFFIFIVLWLCGINEWQIFVYAIPVSMVVLIVENALWGNRIWSFLYISALVWGIIAAVYVAFLPFNWWLLFLLGIPAEIIIWLCFRLKSKKRRK